MVFAPLFFGSLGLRADFAANFDPALVFAVFAIACLGKLVSAAAWPRAGAACPRARPGQWVRA